MAKKKAHAKKIELYVYNYGLPQTRVALFDGNWHDSVQCLRAFNDHLVSLHKKLPTKIFYYLKYVNSLKAVRYYIDCSHEFTMEDYDKRYQLIENAVNTDEIGRYAAH